ncbi:protein of unknown function [Maridesulfovibrio hydrothermalis AM13 = DSM 14728]|uniref:Uncharacterized protein n=1 Tax=Maridesulfovibrio hydrothermalis AM13 = DSM 14728 TaxID=1121451 RepID=L0R724_9BACT|nr:protein of unknown function [Maridesulfovibrio hydrothermalis AM13 = DSM 14728]
MQRLLCQLISDCLAIINKAKIKTYFTMYDFGFINGFVYVPFAVIRLKKYVKPGCVI